MGIRTDKNNKLLLFIGLCEAAGCCARLVKFIKKSKINFKGVQNICNNGQRLVLFRRINIQSIKSRLILVKH